MLATFAFDVCHDVYRSAREVIDTKISTLNLESSGKYTWHPDRLPRIEEYVADFALAGERALGAERGDFFFGAKVVKGKLADGKIGDFAAFEEVKRRQDKSCPTGAHSASRMAMFRMYYLGGAEYHAARRHLGISELTWADWADEIRGRVGRELTRSGVFPPSKYFREASAKAS